jgi:ubiquinone biosynthesis monooxygenase Coq7
MHPEFRHLSPIDRLLSVIDQGLKSVAGDGSTVTGSGRPMPGAAEAAAGPAAGSAAARHSAGLMRVNRAGEVAAQALYHGQALVARDPAVREFLLKAAREEGDHLAWCSTRLTALGARPSLLDPLWFAGAVAIGALAGLAGDRISLGFIAETERQVEGHIDEHLATLPPEDAASRAVLVQMKSDESRHGHDALARGGSELAGPVRALMRLTSKVMTIGAYRI